MKRLFLILTLLFTLTGCADQNKTVETLPKKNIPDLKGANSWPTINIKSWDKTPAINDRVANEEDVQNGLAVYYINNHEEKHRPYKIKLPKLAYLVDHDTKNKELVVVIQIEVTHKDTVAGYRNINGGNGACLFYELEFLDDQTIKNTMND